MKKQSSGKICILLLTRATPRDWKQGFGGKEVINFLPYSVTVFIFMSMNCFGTINLKVNL